MGFALLWLESQALALLFICVVYAVSGRIEKSLPRVAIRVAAFLLPACWGGAYILIAVYLHLGSIEPDWFLAYTISWAAIYLCGFFIIRRFALKGKDAVQACGSWSRPVLIASLGIVLLLFLTTYFKMDMDARAELASAQTWGLAAAVRVKPAPVPYDKNGARLYLKAFEGIALPNWASRIRDPGFIPNMQDTEAVLKENQPALFLLDRAARMPDVSFMPNPAEDRFWPSYETKLPPTYEAMQAAFLLGLDAFLRISRGETEAAFARIKMIGDLAAFFSRTPYFITNALSGRLMKIQKAVLERSFAFSPKVHEQMFDSIEAQGFLMESFRRALIMEEGMFFYSYSKDVSTNPLCALLFTNGNDALNYFLCLFPYRIFVLDSELDFYDRFWKKTYDFFSKPFYAEFQKHQEWEKDMGRHPGGIISAITLAKISGYAINAIVGEANRRLTRLAIATSAYYSEKGAYPARIDNLVPEYIKQIPMDPFDGKPLRMTATAEGVAFYSIGPDFEDNSGSVTDGTLDDKKRSGDIVFRLGKAYDQAFLKPVLPQLAADGNMVVVRRALAAGADIDAVIRLPENKKRGKAGSKDWPLGVDARVIGGMNALMAAALNGHVETVRLLIESGADVNLKSPLGWTPLIAARAGDNKGVEALLMENGASLNPGDTEVINRLVNILEETKTNPQRKQKK